MNDFEFTKMYREVCGHGYVMVAEGVIPCRTKKHCSDYRFIHQRAFRKSITLTELFILCLLLSMLVGCGETREGVLTQNNNSILETTRLRAFGGLTQTSKASGEITLKNLNKFSVRFKIVRVYYFNGSNESVKCVSPLIGPEESFVYTGSVYDSIELNYYTYHQKGALIGFSKSFINEESWYLLNE